MEKPTDPENIAEGDYVRSYDFHHVGDTTCYIEGVVTGFTVMEGCWRYQITVARRVFEGKDREIRGDQEVFPPINGTRIVGGDRLCGGVKKLRSHGDG